MLVYKPKTAFETTHWLKICHLLYIEMTN